MYSYYSLLLSSPPFLGLADLLGLLEQDDLDHSDHIRLHTLGQFLQKYQRLDLEPEDQLALLSQVPVVIGVALVLGDVVGEPATSVAGCMKIGVNELELRGGDSGVNI